jgi:uncharacterized protein YdhG (YjbR/CyaY superfamily)
MIGYTIGYGRGEIEPRIAVVSQFECECSLALIAQKFFSTISAHCGHSGKEIAWVARIDARVRGNAVAAEEVNACLLKLGDDKRAILEKVRKSIRAAAPNATEGLSYGMPAFFFQGKPIAGYKASANHCSYHPMSGAVVEVLQDELRGCATSKGTIRFPIGKPLPATLIRKLIMARLAEIE